MPTAESVITLERFATGKTWQQYLESGIRNRDLFEDNYNSSCAAKHASRATVPG